MTMKDDTIRVRIKARGGTADELREDALAKAAKLENTRYHLHSVRQEGAADGWTVDESTSHGTQTHTLYFEAGFVAIYVPREA